jgi:hypothetical protein
MMLNGPSKSNKQKKKKLVGILKVNGENIAGSGSGSIRQRHGSADPDPDLHQNVMDPQY